jgi:hypothetical protein
MDRAELFERWVSSLDTPLTVWQKELLRSACLEQLGEVYIYMPRHMGRMLVYKLVEQFKQIIGEKK